MGPGGGGPDPQHSWDSCKSCEFYRGGGDKEGSSGADEGAPSKSAPGEPWRAHIIHFETAGARDACILSMHSIKELQFLGILSP